MSRGRFHGGAVAAAACVGAGLALAAPWVARLEPRSGPVGLLTPGDVWLLSVFTAGTLSILVGIATLLGGWPGSGRLRERLDAWIGADGDGTSAGSRAEDARVGTGGPGGWVMAVGGWLLALYLVGWVAGLGSG